MAEYRAAPFPPEGERIVSMLNHKDRILVATETGVYELVDGAWSRMVFVEATPDSPSVPNGERSNG